VDLDFFQNDVGGEWVPNPQSWGDSRGRAGGYNVHITSLNRSCDGSGTDVLNGKQSRQLSTEESGPL
jgi:hypothetical protein